MVRIRFRLWSTTSTTCILWCTTTTTTAFKYCHLPSVRARIFRLCGDCRRHRHGAGWPLLFQNHNPHHHHTYRHHPCVHFHSPFRSIASQKTTNHQRLPYTQLAGMHPNKRRTISSSSVMATGEQHSVWDASNDHYKNGSAEQQRILRSILSNIPSLVKNDPTTIFTEVTMAFDRVWINMGILLSS
jgi:hypothetical protein